MVKKPLRGNEKSNKPWQKQYICNILMAFFGGLFGATVLFIVSFLIFNVAHLESPFLSLPFGKFWDILLVAAILEEGIKFLLIKRGIGEYPYGFILGLGFGLSESTFAKPFWSFPGREFAILLHIATATTLAYFIKKKKPVLGLLVAITLHTGYDLLVEWCCQ